MIDYPNHPIAECYPPPTAQEFAELKADIAANGLIHPVVLYEGQILCGIQRARACKQLGIEPTFITPEIADPITYVISDNEKRRHWSKAQLAIVADKLAKQKKGGDRHWHKSNESNDALDSIKAICKKLGVSKTMIQRLRYAKEHGIPSLFGAVKEGKIPVDRAWKISRLSKEEQQAAFEEATKPKPMARIKRSKKSSQQQPATQPVKSGGRLTPAEIAQYEAKVNAPSIYPEDLPLPVHPSPATNVHLQEAFIDLKAHEPRIPKMSRRWLYQEVWVLTQRIQSYDLRCDRPDYPMKKFDPRWVQWAKSVAGKVRAAECLEVDGPQAPKQDSLDGPPKKQPRFSEAGLEKRLKEWKRLLKHGLRDLSFALDEESRALRAAEEIIITHFEERRTKNVRFAPSQPEEPNTIVNGSPIAQ